MATKPIKWRKKDIKEYNRLKRNMQNKIRYGKQKHNYDWTNQVSIPSRSEIQTREQFNQFKENAKRFTNRFSPKYNINNQFITNKRGTVTARYGEVRKLEIQNAKNIELAHKRINELEQLPYFRQGKERNKGERQFLLGTGNAVGINVPKKFNFDEIETQARYNNIVNYYKDREGKDFYERKQMQMQKNFMKSLQDAFNSDGDEVVKAIGNMHHDDFYQMYLMYADIGNIFYESNDGEVIQDDDDNTSHQKVQRSGHSPKVESILSNIKSFYKFKKNLKF